MRWPFTQKTKKQLASPVPTSLGYKSVRAHRTNNLFFDRPRFTLPSADLMTLDPKITIGMAVRDGLAMAFEATVENGRPEVENFVRDQWGAIWAGAATKLLKTKIYGFRAFEIMYKIAPPGSKWEGMLVYDGIKDFHYRDTRALVRMGEPVGFVLRGARREGEGSSTGPGETKPIYGPKGLWLTYRAHEGRHYGNSIFENSFDPWLEKWEQGGSIQLRKLRMKKDAYDGSYITYPEGWIGFDEQDNKVTGRDIARMVGEAKESGATFSLPSDRTGDGHLKFEYHGPTAAGGVTEIFQYTTICDSEILEGIEVPKEVLEASASGSGFSGRSIPMLAMLAILGEELGDMLRQIDKQVLRPLAALNFGLDPYYEIKPTSLVDTTVKQMGGSEEGTVVGSTAEDPEPNISQKLAAFQGGRGNDSEGIQSQLGAKSKPSQNGISLKPNQFSDLDGLLSKVVEPLYN